jgi:hypothetical protein
MALLNRSKNNGKLPLLGKPDGKKVEKPAERRSEKTILTSKVVNKQKSSNISSANQEIKEKIHRRLIDNIDLDRVESIPAEELKNQVRDVVETPLLISW